MTYRRIGRPTARVERDYSPKVAKCLGTGRGQAGTTWLVNAQTADCAWAGTETSRGATDNTKYRSARMPDRDLALSESWQAIDVAQVLRLRCGGFGERATPGENGGAHRGSPKRSSQGATTLSDLGVTRDQSSQRQQLAVDTWARY